MYNQFSIFIDFIPKFTTSFLSIVILVKFLLISEYSLCQKLEKHQRDSLKCILNKMGEDDQKYRWQIMFGELDEKKLDSLKKLKIKVKLEYIQRALSYRVGFNKQIRDSLFALQNTIDYQNKEQFIAIIHQYGYPSKKRVKSTSSSYLILHFTQPDDFEYFFPIFTSELLKGNMPPKEFASWYDRCQLFMHKKKLYGEYDTKYPCVEDLDKTNLARKNIGLKPIRKNKCK